MSIRRELWFTGPGRVELRDSGPPRVLEAGEVRAHALASGVSQGTELLLYRGEGPTPFDPSLDRPETPTYPRRYGYAWVGEIVDSRAEEVRAGDRIFALAPHGDEHVLDARALRALPASLPAPRATLAANLETALTVVWDARVAFGDRVVVLGGGVVGLLSAWLASRAGARVRLVEPTPKRRAAGLALGVDDAVTPDEDDARADADVVIEATGHPAALDRAIDHARDEATVVVASFYGERKSAIALGSDFHRRRLRLKASQVSRLPPHMTPRWTMSRRFALVVELLGDATLDALVDPIVAFDDAPAAYARLASDPNHSVQAVLQYRAR